MLFSSMTFLFLFFPLILILYFLVKNIKCKNIILLIFSLVFYAWGEPVYILLMLFSILINYLLAILIDKSSKKSKKKIILIISLIINILIITFFKYSNFLIDIINNLIGTSINNLKLSLPIGISFYTFQVISYVIDVYKNKVKVQKNLINLATYISLFPQLIAGPIVRYQTIASELDNRKTTFDDFVYGLKRFVIGLGKKVIIANNMALIADTIFATPSEASSIMLWIAAIAYTFQIYFDFSGYSDMAIGLGRIFGFHFLENFNYPYVATSITDFWRRWHISLSSWFKDYVYIPLGGNRCKSIIWVRNMLIVWSLTGLWHGASWNFVLWGIYYFVFLIVEKLFLSKYLNKLPKVLTHIYSLFIIVIGWVIFRIDKLGDLFLVLKGMFIPNNNDTIYYFYEHLDTLSKIILFIIAIIGSMPIYNWIEKRFKNNNIYNLLNMLFVVIIFIISICFLISSTYNPFIYFRF